MYGEEAMLPEEIRHGSLRVRNQEIQENEAIAKDKLESHRLEVVLNIQQYQKETRPQTDKKVVRKKIEDGDLVLQQRPNEKQNKFQMKWKALSLLKRKEAYKLMDKEGNEMPHTWNIDNLQRFYM